MSPTIRTLAIAIIAFSPFTTANPVAHGDNFGFSPSCATSCVLTVTTTVTALAPCSKISSAVQTSLPNATSTYSHGHHKHLHRNSTIASWTMNSTSTTEPTTTAGPFEPTDSNNSTHHHRHSHPTSSLIILPSASSIFPTSTSTPPNHCNHDNCLRQFIRQPEVTGFCATYTATTNTATAELPTYVSQCNAEPSRISSACSCIATGISPPSSTAIETIQTNDGTFASATTSLSAPAQTSTYTTPSTCPSILFETWTTTLHFVATVTLDQESTIAAGATTSWSSSSTALATSGSSVVVPTTSVRDHQHKHGERWSA
jgi:hypothetical protein